MSPKQSTRATITWLKIIGIVIVVGFIKFAYDDLASEGNPLTALMFKVRAPYLDPNYLRKVVPTSFRMTKGTDTRKIETESETFTVEYTYSYPQLEYYGEVLGRSELNRLVRDNFEGVEARIWEAFKADARRHLSDKTLIPGFGSQAATLKIKGEVSYFSKSVVAVRYRVEWSFGGDKELYPARRVAGFSADIALSRQLQLRDVIGYPYQDFLTRLWDRARVELEDAHHDVSKFHLYHDDPEFYISPVGVVLVNLSDAPEYTDVEVKIPFRDNRLLFRNSGPIGHIANPVIDKVK